MASNPRQSRRVVNKEKSITVITRDNIRTLKPHSSQKQKGPAMLLSCNELERIKDSAVFLSKDELHKYNHELNNQRITAAEAARARK
ncbi:hypothetical protein HDU98_002682, partial [Podochytrium sp. JEL0797]